MVKLMFVKSMKIIFLAILIIQSAVIAHAEEPTDLYARSAVLMDADSGRILFAKNGSEQMPMASTTKIMTLLVTLENADLEGIVQISSYAASMPDVQLNVREGERYRLKDLCYSLMLESHNDAAVAIAEHVAGNVDAFADMMNQKARDLGCYYTYFITSNGLDAEDGSGVHSTTAEDLARIMRYCIQNETFLEITRQNTWSFSDLEGKRSFTIYNKNAFLHMMDGALTGKTGFTNDAGYCYVGALERDGKRLIAVVLACGWPNNRGWKWIDTQKLMTYGLEQFETGLVGTDDRIMLPIRILDGQVKTVMAAADVQIKRILMSKTDEVSVEMAIPEELPAPVVENEIVGNVVYSINERVVEVYPVYLTGTSLEIDIKWCLWRIVNKYIDIL